VIAPPPEFVPPERRAGRAKRALAQNFLIDQNLQKKIAAELEAEASDTVLEVGPGHGELTGHLLGRVRRLVLIEKDQLLAADLSARWGDREDVEVYSADALETDLGGLADPRRPLRVLSNVPYNITSPLLFAFLAIRPPARRIVVTIQKEVAERIVARPGTKSYGALSVGVQAIATAAIAFKVGRQAFRPTPEVDSAVVRIDPDPDRCEAIDASALRVLTRMAFGRRRKQLQKILRTAPELSLDARQVAELCERLDLDPRSRPEELDPAVFVRMAEILVPGRGIERAGSSP
jgi:16S rRNA (adenine1518-N6/adenine1519-N6)-dimethyltransferase